MRLAVIADVHGNALALQAVLDDLRAAAPDALVNLGDLVSGPYDPAAAATLQMQAGATTVRGNHDRWVCRADASGSDGLARPFLSADQLAWIANLPATAVLGDVFACHGSPAGGDLDYLLEDVATGHPVLAPAAAIAAKLAGIGSAAVVLCGHTHVARAATVGGVLVVNPGSVGMPAYSFHEPCQHTMQSGTPHARYALVTRRGGAWGYELRGVPYDWAAAAAQAAGFGRAETARATATGRLD